MDKRPFLATIITPPQLTTEGSNMLQVLNGPTIAEGESLSDAIDCSAGQLVCITMPDAWDDGSGNKSACLTFQYSPDGKAYTELCDFEGFAVTVPAVVPNATVVVSQDVGRATAWMKFRSGTKGDPVVQTSARAFSVSIMTDAPSGWGEPVEFTIPPKKSAKKKPVKKPAKKTAKKR